MIFTDQVGYLPGTPKIAVSTSPCNFQVIRVSDQKCVFDGTTSAKIDDTPCSGECVYQIDFSPLNEEGEYYILAGNHSKSHSFRIGNDIYKSVQNDALRCLYFQRCGCDLPERFAGRFAHPACHTAPVVMLNDYIKKTPDPVTFDATGGWHDAGDYGRYSSAAAVALGHLLYAYELFPESFNDSINIPESGNGIPDILNECLYELNWLLKMQKKDGGVYHKVTAFRHADFIMPQDDADPFMFYPVSSFATADFVAVMALSYRVYKPFLPDFAEKAFTAAIKGTEWLSKNPYTPFKNPEGSNTGGYYDDADIDERLWAACEMLRIDNAHRDDYISVITDLTHDFVSKADFGWADVSGLASMSILTDPEHRSGMLEAKCRHDVLTVASKLIETGKNSAYRLAMEADDFVWGSNMVILNRAMLFILSSKITDSPVSDKYITAAMEHLHYILGRNPLDISYVTGHGENAFKNPHGRVTALVGGEPMPGWVSGGPFKNFMDPSALAAIPKGTAPMKCYVDEVGSYSTNEITIYWNSPLVFLCAFLNSGEWM